MTLFSKGLILSIVLLLTFGCQPPEEQETEEKKAEHKYAHLLNQNPDSISYEQLYNRALNLWTLPFEEIDCGTSYGKAHVLVTGPQDAPPIVLLHGMNASSTSWYPNIDALSENHRVYAIDFLLEVNRSEQVVDVDGTDGVVAWYEEVFVCLGLTDFDLIGASRGGWLATKISLEHPERVKKLVLLSPAQTLMWIPPSVKLFKNLVYTLRPNQNDLRDAMETLSINVDKIDQLYIDQYYRATTEAVISSELLEMKPFKDRELHRLKMPVLVLIGDHDFINKKPSIQQAKKSIPNVTTGTILNAGHFLTMDQAVAVNTQILAFLNGAENP